MPALQLHFLGPPRLTFEGQLVEPDTRKATALLAYLALTGERQSRDALSALLWPEYDEQRGRAALRRTLSTLKAIMGDTPFFTSREIIGLEPGQFTCDVHQFRQYLKEQKWDAAAALYRDDFLTGFSLRDSIPFDDWQLLQAQTLKRELEHCLETLVQQLAQHQQWEAALNYAHRWLQRDPLREEAHRHLMQIYAQQGRREAALRQYQTCVTILNEELGVSPLAETTALAQTIESNSFITTPPPAAPVLVLIPPAIPLVGRANALTTLQQAFTQVAVNGYFLAISGEAGIGKTRLVETFFVGRRPPGHHRHLSRRGKTPGLCPFCPGIAGGSGLAHSRKHTRQLPSHRSGRSRPITARTGGTFPPSARRSQRRPRRTSALFYRGGSAIDPTDDRPTAGHLFSR
ncbi:MAG: hypothetical protein IPL78_36145 [Chloroflexi bacterium]|nr:hypothetical protein [Chloroflexota bacterium]